MGNKVLDGFGICGWVGRVSNFAPKTPRMLIIERIILTGIVGVTLRPSLLVNMLNRYRNWSQEGDFYPCHIKSQTADIIN